MSSRWKEKLLGIVCLTECRLQVALQCDCGRRKETVACNEAATSYQRSVLPAVYSTSDILHVFLLRRPSIMHCRYAAIAMASKLSDMQLGDSMDIGPLLTKKELKQTR